MNKPATVIELGYMGISVKDLQAARQVVRSLLWLGRQAPVSTKPK